MRLSGKNALVTGTSRGIGPAIASALAEEGARVLCHARSEADARARAEELSGVAIFGELSTEDGIASIAGQAIAAAPKLHVLVHNAATNPRGHEPFDEVERGIFEDVLYVNVFAPLFSRRRCCSRSVPQGAHESSFSRRGVTERPSPRRMARSETANKRPVSQIRAAGAAALRTDAESASSTRKRGREVSSSDAATAKRLCRLRRPEALARSRRGAAT